MFWWFTGWVALVEGTGVALGGLLGRSWGLLGRSWGLLGRSWDLLGRSWVAWGAEYTLLRGF